MNGWTLHQFLTQAKQIGDLSVQVDDMKMDKGARKYLKLKNKIENGHSLDTVYIQFIYSLEHNTVLIAF